LDESGGEHRKSLLGRDVFTLILAIYDMIRIMIIKRGN